MTIFFKDNKFSRRYSGVEDLVDIYHDAFRDRFLMELQKEGFKELKNYESDGSYTKLMTAFSDEKKKKKLESYLKEKNYNYNIDPEVHVRSIMDRLKRTPLVGVVDVGGNEPLVNAKHIYLYFIFDSAKKFVNGEKAPQEYSKDVSEILHHSRGEFYPSKEEKFFQFEDRLANKALLVLPMAGCISNPEAFGFSKKLMLLAAIQQSDMEHNR